MCPQMKMNRFSGHHWTSCTLVFPLPFNMRRSRQLMQTVQYISGQGKTDVVIYSYCVVCEA